MFGDLSQREVAVKAKRQRLPCFQKQPQSFHVKPRHLKNIIGEDMDKLNEKQRREKALRLKY